MIIRFHFFPIVWIQTMKIKPTINNVQKSGKYLISDSFGLRI